MKTEQATKTVKPVAVEDLRVFISQALTALGRSTDLIEELLDTRQHGLGFLSAEGKRILDDLVKGEKAVRLEHAKANLQLVGDSPVPGNLQAISFVADIYTTLRHLVRKIIEGLARSGVCTVHQLPAQPTVDQLIAHIRTLSWHLTNVRLLSAVLRELEYLVDEATRLLDGDDKAKLDGPCPHCERKTLVVTFREGLIRCDRDPHSGEFEDCVCPDPLCECKTNPHHRHEWYRDRGTAGNGWWSLADRLNLTKQITN